VYRPFKANSENAVLGVDGGPVSTPTVFALEQNYPNPFNGQTRISIQVPYDGMFRLAVYDLLGREVALLIDGRLTPDRYSVDWLAEDLASGMYICRAVSRNTVRSLPMILLR
jgi:hypothetical protein